MIELVEHTTLGLRVTSLSSMLSVDITEKKKKKRLYKVMIVLTNLMMVIITQCTCISVQIITLYLKLTR